MIFFDLLLRYVTLSYINGFSSIKLTFHPWKNSSLVMQRYPSCSWVGLGDDALGQLRVYAGPAASPDFGTRMPRRTHVTVSSVQAWDCVSACSGKVTHKVTIAWGSFLGSATRTQCL